MVLEWDVQQAHIGVMVRCPHTFGHIVYKCVYYHIGTNIQVVLLLTDHFIRFQLQFQRVANLLDQDRKSVV